MYKVFVNDHLLIIGNEPLMDSSDVEVLRFSKTNLLELVNQLLKASDPPRCILLKTKKVKTSWAKFKQNFKKIDAAGGKVVNKKNEVLFIYRHQKWDLPKGKLEKDEKIEACALREVEEECGIKGLTIKDKLAKTFHIYPGKKKLVLKTTHWFRMQTSDDSALKPQKEEGIEIAVFKNPVEVDEALKNTFGNIKLLF